MPKTDIPVVRPRRGRLRALLLVAVLLVSQATTATSASAAAGDLSTAAGTIGTGTATSLGIGSRGLTWYGGSLYITDLNYHVIRRVNTTTGIASVVAGTGIAGFDGDGGPATAAMLNTPADVQFDTAGNMYIADSANNRIRKVTPGGIISTVAGTGVGGTTGDGGPATSAQLNFPRGVGVDGLGQLYISEFNGAGVVRKVSAGGTISTLDAAFTGSRNFAFDGANNVYITTCNHTIKRYPSGGGAGTEVAGAWAAPGGTGDGGLATAATVNCPIGIVYFGGKVYFADNTGRRLRVFTPGGNINHFAGSTTGVSGYSGDGGLATAAIIDNPLGVTADSAGNIYFAQRNNFDSNSLTSTAAIRKITAADGKISTVAGNSWNGFSGDGAAATSAQLYNPTGIATDASNNLYIADTQNNRIRKITGTTISTVAGDGFFCDIASTPCPAGNMGDGGSALTASLANPAGVAVTSTGDVIIADTLHHRIRKVSGGTITTIAGTATAGYNGEGTATSMQLNTPTGIAVDSSNNIYIADTGNNRIRKITGTTISTIAGTGTAGATGDTGLATAATVNAPKDVSVDALGTIYIADTGNNKVRQIVAGKITSIAGTGTAGSSGDGGDANAAMLSAPAGVIADSAGNVYVSDSGNSVVRRIERHGDIHTVAGNAGEFGYAGDGGSGTAASVMLGRPTGLAIDAAGALYIATTADNRIRKLATQPLAATWWTSDSTTGHTGVTYAWEIAVASGTAIGAVTFTVPSAANANATGLYVVTAFGLPTTGTLTLSAGVLTYTLAGGVTLPVGQHIYLSVSGFTNTATAGTYASTVTTKTTGAATIDVSQSGSIPFSSGTAATSMPVPNAATTITAPATVTIQADPLNNADVQLPASLSVRSTATSGYTLSVSGTAMTGIYGTITAATTGISTGVATGSFGTNRFGYKVTVGSTAVGDPQGTLNSGYFAGYKAAGENTVAAVVPTSAAGDAITVSNRVKINWLQPAGTYLSTLTYTVTPLS